MKKQLFIFLLMTILPLSALAGEWTDSESGVVYRYDEGESHASVCGLIDWERKDVVILSRINVDGNVYVVTTISAKAFVCHGNLESIIIPETVTVIEDFAFSGCENLARVVFPGTMSYIYIGSGAFTDCCSLSDITLPKGLTSIEPFTFENCSSLSRLIIPEGVTKIAEYASGYCPSLTSISIPSTVECIESFAFMGCPNLNSITSYIMNPKLDSDVFSEETYQNATLFVPLGTIDAYRLYWSSFDNIEEFSLVGLALTLTVTNKDGVNLTNQVHILWYDVDGKEIGEGKSIGGIDEGTELYYSVLLDEELGRAYREVRMRKVVAGGETVNCQLEKIGRVMLEGRVSATDIDNTSVTVIVKQLLNGKWEQDYTVQTDEQGVFKVEVYDDVTDITVSGDGYFDTTLHRDGFGGNGHVGTIPVSLISGFAIAANITLQTATEPAENVVWADGLNDIDFTMANTTNGTAITDFTVQNGSVIIRTGADVGDNISLVAKSKKGEFADATTSFIIKEGANSFDLQLTELGGMAATCAATNNGSTEGYLYNSSDVLVAKGNYIGETLSLRHLPSGIYTLVSMGNSKLLGSMTQLEDLNKVGMREGTDYVATRVEIADGELTAVSVDEVPRLDEAPFCYTTGNTYFNVNKPSVMVGNYLALSAYVEFKTGLAADAVTLTIDLPEGCQMVEKSVIANHQTLAYTVSGQRITIPLDKEHYGSVIRFCIIPVINRSYTITAMASFDMGGRLQQPIGTARFEAKGFSLSVPAYVSRTNIIVTGTAKAHSEVKIYDNNVFIGNVFSKADGSWMKECELYNPANHSFHDIYARIPTESGMELMSETRQVEYDKNNLIPERIIMLYSGNTTAYDLIQAITSPSNYTYVPSINDFTFLADFTRNDSTIIKNVNIMVLNNDGTVRTLPAIYDGKQNCWVATTKYENSSRLPINATVDYMLIRDDSDVEREEGLSDQATVMVNCNQQLGRLIDEKARTELLEGSDNSLLFDCRLDGIAASFFCQVEAVDYSEAERMMTAHQFLYAEEDGSRVGYYAEYGEDVICIFSVDLDGKTACRLVISSPEASRRVAKAKASSDSSLRAKILGMLKWSADIGLTGELGDAWGAIGTSLGITEYLNVNSDFDTMCRRILGFMDNYDNYRQRTIDLLAAKCPNGDYRLPNDQKERFYKAVQAATDVEVAFEKEYYAYLDRYKVLLWGNVLSFFANYFAGKALGLMSEQTKVINFVSKNSNLLPLLKKIPKLGINDKVYTAMLGNALGAFLGKISDFTDFNKKKDEIFSWSTDRDKEITENYVKLQQGIVKAYKRCSPTPPDDQGDDGNQDRAPSFPASPTTPLIDPSGFVYEAVMSNRLEGVTATCYQQEDGKALVWNAEDYSQQNPLKTDATGFYRWDVPQGMWQVKYEKEGYETAYSDWLPVPPPQLDVNIGMKQNTPPTVKQTHGYEGGITIKMSKYMLPTTMTAQSITVTRNGIAERGTIELTNAEQTPVGDETYVSKVKFVPETSFNTTDVVVLTVHKEVESYCGVQMTADYVETVKIEPEVKSIVVDNEVSVYYQDERELLVQVLPKDASAGRTLCVHTSSPMIASVNKEEVTVNENGVAILTIAGNLPGGAIIDFTVDGTDVVATSKIMVAVRNNYLVATPVASIATGSVVGKGTQVTLSCATENASIYYTLDGSCPCDEQTRHLYDGPITVMDIITIKAIAVKEDMDDSDVASFTYYIKDPSGISIPTVSATDGTIYNINGQRVTIPNKGVFIQNGRKTVK